MTGHVLGPIVEFGFPGDLLETSAGSLIQFGQISADDLPGEGAQISSNAAGLMCLLRVTKPITDPAQLSKALRYIMHDVRVRLAPKTWRVFSSLLKLCRSRIQNDFQQH
jgi:hypothetical protein